jgi:hypothetical protein
MMWMISSSILLLFGLYGKRGWASYIIFCLAACVGSTAIAQPKIEQLIRRMETRTAEMEREVKDLQAELAKLKRKKTSASYGFIPIVTSPYLEGANSNSLALDPSGLIVTLSGYNQDLGLLKQRQALGKFFKQGLVQVSGILEAQAVAMRNPDGTHASDIDLSEAEIHLHADLSPWVMGFVSIAYDNTQLPNTNTRLTNSSVYLDKGFITIGNLDKAPVYMTVGQRYVAFGHYDNYMATAPLTRLLGRVRARQISVSYQHPSNTGLYATIFTFRGDTQVLPGRHINQIGGSLGYEFKNNAIKADVGIDYINNLADSEGMLALAFDQNPNLVKRAPAVAIHAKIGFGDYTFITEYIGAVTPFDARNLSFNGVGAKPQALDTVLVYSFTSWKKPSDFSIGYTKTRDALALFFPERRISANYNIVVLKNTILSVEYRRDQNYALTNTATAQGAPRPVDGGYSNTVTGMLTYYF